MFFTWKILIFAWVLFTAKSDAEPIYVALGGGQTFSVHSDTNTSGSALLGSSKSETDDKGAPYGEIEISTYEAEKTYGLIYGTYEYTYSSGPPHDKVGVIVLLPRYRSKNLWFGLGGGIAVWDFGDSSTQSGSNTITIQDTSKTGLLLHARIGADFELNEKFFLSGAFGYSYAKVSILSDVRNTATSAFVGQLESDITRTWATAILSVGLKLNN